MKRLFQHFIIISSIFLSCSSKEVSESRETEKSSPVGKKSAKEIAPTNNEKTSVSNVADGKDAISFYFTPSVDEKIVMEQGQVLLEFLEKETKMKFRIVVPKSYDQMIEDFGNGKADVAIMNSLSYVKAHENYGATAKLRAVRYGKSIYFGQIIANASKGINSIKDINGKKIAFTDPSSTSGYLFPNNILKKNGVKPATSMFAGKHDKVVELVYRGVVDAGATFHSEPSSTGEIRDARARLLKKYPDVAEKVKIIEVTSPIPNDPVVYRKGLAAGTTLKISLGILKFVSTQEGEDVMKAVYSTEGFVRCSDSDYDALRTVLSD